MAIARNVCVKNARVLAIFNPAYPRALHIHVQVAVMKEVGASKRLGHLIEGESLLNDGSAYVVFLIFFDMVKGEGQSAGATVGYFAELVFVACLIGVAFGVVMTIFLVLVYRYGSHNPFSIDKYSAYVYCMCSIVSIDSRYTRFCSNGNMSFAELILLRSHGRNGREHRSMLNTHACTVSVNM
jgi:hypothetical protein